MGSRKLLIQETTIIAAGQAACVGLMIGIFALVGKFNTTVLLGGLMGGAIATANFFIMSLVVTLASKKAEAQDVAGGQKLIQLSYMGRMLGLFIVLAAYAKSGFFHPLALVLPLVFNRPILTAAEYFRKKGEKNNEHAC